MGDLDLEPVSGDRLPQFAINLEEEGFISQRLDDDRARGGEGHPWVPTVPPPQDSREDDRYLRQIQFIDHTEIEVAVIGEGVGEEMEPSSQTEAVADGYYHDPMLGGYAVDQDPKWEWPKGDERPKEADQVADDPREAG